MSVASMFGGGMSDVVVVGAGVSGLTTAVCLAEAGRRVAIVAAGTDAETTSYAAGATWSPYLVEFGERAQRWSFATLATLRELAGQEGTGVALRSGVELSGDGPPPWSARLQDFTEIEDGWRLVAPVVDMPAYLSYLRRRAEAAGITITRGRITSLDAVDASLVVNCAGVGARELAADPSLVPVRGQVVIVANPGITEFFVSESDPPVYWFPQGDTLLLGGTADIGAEDTEPDPATAEAIVARCAEVDKRIAGAAVLEHRVGLRPTRPAVRLERDGRVIHNYGHGGAGVTLSWGCAREAAGLA
jgi:D-amino-acid oxidase